ncbi:MAG: alpha/beta fold hydrolase [Acidimicrobiia bacterium]
MTTSSPTTGDPVLLVHGMASSFELNWREPGWVDLLADAGRQVIGVDLLGHGEAPKPHDAGSYVVLEDRVLDALPPAGTVEAVGFSLGAMTLLRAALARPERFARLVVAGIGSGIFESRGPATELADAIEKGEPIEGGMASLFVQFANHPGNDRLALAACMRADRPAIDRAALATITCPVLVVLGDQDEAGDPTALVEAFPDARLKVLRNTEHFGTPRSFEFIDATLEFLDAVPT